MSVEYGLFPISIIVFLIMYSLFKNLKRTLGFEIALFLMLIVQNLTNDLLYAPDIGIYFWLVPTYFISNSLRVKN